MSDDEFTMDGALLEASLVPGAQLFVFPAQGQVEAIFVIAPDRMVFELRSEFAVEWLDAMVERGLRAGSFVDLEAALAAWCEWIPTLYRGVILGVQTPEQVAGVERPQ